VSEGIGTLLGLQPGVPDPGWNGAALRIGLTLVALLWAWLTARERPVVSLLAGIVWLAAGTGFWLICLQRPYGLFEDPEAVHRIAEIAVVAASGNAGEGVLAGQPAAHASWTAWLDRGASATWLMLLPSLAPVVVPVTVALVLFVLIRPRERAFVSALMWLMLATGQLDASRGLGVLPELWGRAVPGLGLVAGALAAAIAVRLRIPVIARALLVAGLAAGGSAAVSSGNALAPTEALLALTLDQGLLLPVAAIGLARGRDPLAAGLAAGGGAAVLAGAIAPVADVWLAHAFYRLGLILAASGPLLDLARRSGEPLARRLASTRAAGLEPVGLGAALLVLVLAPASFVTWWDPDETDPAFSASREPVTPALVEAMSWIRRETPPGAVFIADEAYATAVPVLGGRRLLRSPGLLQPADEGPRADAERRLLQQKHLRDWVYRYGVRYVFAAPGDFAGFGIRSPEDLGTRPGFRLVYANREGYRVYEIPTPIR
jgi:hypothetical protein